MAFLRTLNKKLNKAFHGQVSADEEGGCLVLSGALERWNDVVLAGKIAADDNPYFGLVNDIECVGEKAMPVRKPKVEDSALEWEEPDVLIIGGGVIGCAIARELSKYKLSILLVEKEHDIAMQASGRNLGVVQSGAGLKKGSLRHKFARLGNELYPNLCSDLEIDYIRSGQIFYLTKRLWDPFLGLTSLYWKWLGIKDAKVIGRDDLLRYEPGINHNIGKAVLFPSTGIVYPFDLTIALAENAVQNGVTISLNTIVQSMVTEDGMIKTVKTNRGNIKPKVVVNAAGVFCESVAAMAGDRFYSIHPIKGMTAVLDRKYTNELIQSVVTSRGIASAKKKHTRDGSVVRTIYGSTLIGPDIFETIHKEDFSTSPYNLRDVIEAQRRSVPDIEENQVIAYFSGVQAVTYEDDFIITKGKYITNIVHAAGIQAPGLTAAPAISIEIADMVLDFFGGKNTVGDNSEFDPKRAAPIRPDTMADEAKSALIESNPDYGIMVCSCEGISKGEIVAAMRRGVRCDTIDGVKRRVRSGMGRCHGSHCMPLVLDLISSEKRLAPHNVRKSGSGSEKLFGLSKKLMQDDNSFGSRDFSLGKTDPETVKRIEETAKAMMLSKLGGKDSVSNVDE